MISYRFRLIASGRATTARIALKKGICLGQHQESLIIQILDCRTPATFHHAYKDIRECELFENKDGRDKTYIQASDSFSN